MGAQSEAAKARLIAAFEARLGNPDTVEMIRRAIAAEVVMDTWLAGRREESFEPEALGIIEREVGYLTEQANGKVFPSYRLSSRYLTTAFHELLASTALFLANRAKGNLEVDEEEAMGAVKRLEAFIAAERDGINSPVGLYWLLTAYESYGALLHYGRIKEKDFRFGTFHRPWIRYALDEELNLSQLLGHVDVRQPCPEEWCVLLTPQGRRVYQEIRRILVDSGEMSWRLQQQHLALFNEVQEYDDLFNRVASSFATHTERFLDFCGIEPGMSILELGCGTGRMTLNCRLFRRLLPGGQVVATDPSVNMLAAARAKATRMGVANVEFVQASAEVLPFPDASFDEAVGFAFLHFTDAPRAVREICRVVKPGGTVAMAVGMKQDAAMMPVLPIWFEPVFRVAQKRGLSQQTMGNQPGEAATLMQTAGLVEVETVPCEAALVAEDAMSFVQFVLRGTGAFQEALEPLPYAERMRLVEELEEAGKDICAKTTLEERTWRGKGEFVSGRVPCRDNHC